MLTFINLGCMVDRKARKKVECVNKVMEGSRLAGTTGGVVSKL